MTLVDDIRAAVEPVVAARGCSLYDVEVSGTGRGSVLRVLVDRAGGIDLDTVARVSEDVSHTLDHAPATSGLRGPYALEVSSPGLERPLRRPEHFTGATGSLVSVKVRATDVPARRIRGVLVAFDGEVCEVALDDGTTERIAFGDIVQARTVFEMPAARSKQAKEVAPR
jgi:ribosome maturation factor RimP